MKGETCWETQVVERARGVGGTIVIVDDATQDISTRMVPLEGLAWGMGVC